MTNDLIFYPKSVTHKPKLNENQRTTQNPKPEAPFPRLERFGWAPQNEAAHKFLGV